METERATRLSVLLVTAVALLVWTSPASAASLRPGGIGPRGSGLRLSASGTNETSGVSPDLGGRHTCAVIADGSVRCWGNGSAGQLGNGDVNPSNVPVTVTRPGGGALTGVVGVAAGAEHTCASRAEGTVFCWGDNRFGRLGLGDQILPSSNVALQVKVGTAAFTGAVMVAAGTQHTCALRFDGTVHCWGRNSHRQLGIDFLSASSSPVPVGLTGDI